MAVRDLDDGGGVRSSGLREWDWELALAGGVFGDGGDAHGVGVGFDGAPFGVRKRVRGVTPVGVTRG